MKKFFLIIIILFFNIIQNKNDISSQKFNFSTNMKFEEFKLQLENYANNISFPKID